MSGDVPVAQPAIRKTFARVDLTAIEANATALAAAAGVELCAVVKADAYGHGAVPVARVLAGHPAVAALAVALVEEALELRDAGVRGPILMMGADLGRAHEEVVAREVLPLVSRADDLAEFGAIGRRRGRPVEVHLKVDTGMHRLGFAPAELAALAVQGVRVTGVATHLACADTDDPRDPGSATRAQLQRFAEVRAALRRAGCGELVAHAANSAGALFFPEARCDRVRPGIALYGNGPRPPELELRPAVELRSAVVALRRVAAGEAVSYGALWRAERDSAIAVVPIGYADGVPRLLTGKREVLVRGTRCPIAGAVCMDMVMVDVTAVAENVGVGDDVILLGAQGQQRIVPAEWAAHTGLSEYEVTCGISKRVPRVYG